ELAAFKYFVWTRSFLNFKAGKGEEFSFNYPGFEEHHAIGKQIINVCNSIPTTDILNITGINTTLLQIEYYYEAGALVSREQALILFDKMEILVNHLEKEAELGCKFNIGEQPNLRSASYRLFNNQLIQGDNSLLADFGDLKVTYLNHSFIHFIG